MQSLSGHTCIPHRILNLLVFISVLIGVLYCLTFLPPFPCGDGESTDGEHIFLNDFAPIHTFFLCLLLSLPASKRQKRQTHPEADTQIKTFSLMLEAFLLMRSVQVKTCRQYFKQSFK